MRWTLLSVEADPTDMSIECHYAFHDLADTMVNYAAYGAVINMDEKETSVYYLTFPGDGTQISETMKGKPIKPLDYNDDHGTTNAFRDIFKQKEVHRGEELAFLHATVIKAVSQQELVRKDKCYSTRDVITDTKIDVDGNA